MNAIGKTILKYRKQKELTREELGREMSVDTKTVSRWERGIVVPNGELLRKLSEVLDFAPEEIISENTREIKRHRIFDIAIFCAFFASLILIASMIAIPYIRDEIIDSYFGEPIRVSIVELIANPERYHGKEVRVIGVGNLEFEGNYIALSKEEWEHYGYNRIWISLDKTKVSYEEAAAYNGKYVIVEGIFNMYNTGHFSSYQGAIEKVSRYDISFTEFVSKGIDLEYFSAGRYTATIVENDRYVFWADSNGLNRYDKIKESEELTHKLSGADRLAVYDDYMYFVIDDKELCRINIRSGELEKLFDSSENSEYLSQITDYTVYENKIYFLNTHCLFYFDIESKSVTKLLDTSVYTLQVYEDTVYFIDNAENTFTVYAYSLEDGSVKNVIGEGTERPAENICSDFRVSDGKMYFSTRVPYKTNVMTEDGNVYELYDGELHFSSRTEKEYILYCVSFDEETSVLYNLYPLRENEISENTVTLEKFHLGKGFTVVDGYLYYNSGYEVKTNNVGDTIYDYSSSTPTCVKIEWYN